MPFIIVTVLLQVLFVIHIMRTGRPYVWAAVVMFLPIAGMIAYLIMEILPDLMGSAPARAAATDVVKLVDPERGYREALRRVEIADTPANRATLAEQCLHANRFDEAQALYRGLLVGINATEPDLMLGLARAHFGLGRYDLTQNVLDDLRASNPDYRSADGHLLYARALEHQGKRGEAADEYAELINYYPGQEAKCRYAALLGEMGRTVESRRMFGEICRAFELMPRHARRAQAEWRAFARRHLTG
jgi:hypothetical protein